MRSRGYKQVGLGIVMGAAAILAAALFAFPTPAQAQYRSFYYPNYNVDIVVNKDSSVDVTERLTYVFDGTFRGVTRDITLFNRSRDQLCTRGDLTCGGFERIALIGVYDEQGRQLDPGEYELFIQTDEDAGESYFSLRWEVWPGGKEHTNTEFTWSIKYRLYGSIGWIGSSPQTAVPYLYWNALPSNRGGDVKQTTISVAFPAGVTVDDSNLQVFNTFATRYTASFAYNLLRIRAQDIGAYGDFTIAYELPAGSVDRPGKLTYGGLLPMFGVGVIMNGIDLGDIGGRLDSLPTGIHDLVFYRDGYSNFETSIQVQPEQEISVEVNLDPEPFTIVLIVLSLLLNLVGVALIPIGLVTVYYKWQNKGRDINMSPSIYPQYQPPEGVQPYMLGSLIDETVDRRDVTGSIIDLAYRGYIKIKEIKVGENYQLNRLEGKPGDKGLNEFEQQLLDDLFGKDKTQVETKKLGNTFATRYYLLVKKIYREMVSRGFFSSSPEQTRHSYAGLSVGLIMGGVVIAFVLTAIWIGLIGIPGPFFLGLAAVFSGIAWAVISKYMPAKTAEGSRVLAQILGFKMYLQHAERYRLQNLTPEEFERYLSYAVVLEIEKEWANSFADIYKGPPDWYDGASSNTVWDAYWMSRFTNNFSRSLNSTVYQTLPSGTGSARGSGWSGSSGSFGGFSGGGGGGGRSGAF